MSISVSAFKDGDIVRVSVPDPLPETYWNWGFIWKRNLCKLDGELVQLTRRDTIHSGWRFMLIDGHSDHLELEKGAWNYVDEAWLFEYRDEDRQGCLFL